MVIIANGYSTSFLNYNHQANKNYLGAAIEPPNRVLIVIPPNEWHVFILCFYRSTLINSITWIVRQETPCLRSLHTIRTSGFLLLSDAIPAADSHRDRIMRLWGRRPDSTNRLSRWEHQIAQTCGRAGRCYSWGKNNIFTPRLYF